MTMLYMVLRSKHYPKPNDTDTSTAEQALLILTKNKPTDAGMLKRSLAKIDTTKPLKGNATAEQVFAYIWATLYKRIPQANAETDIVKLLPNAQGLFRFNGQEKKESTKRTH